MRETTYSTKNKERKLNRANDHYKISKVTLGKKARNKYKELSKQGKNIKMKHGRKRCHSTSEERNQRLKEY